MIRIPGVVRISFFTLWEILIVIAIISTVAGVIGINVIQAVREQRFRTETARVVDKLRLAQDLMLLMGIGTEVRFEVIPESSGIKMVIKTDVPLPGHWQHILQAPEDNLTAIHWIQIKELEHEGRLVVKFLSEEAGITQGLLRLSTSKSDETLGALSAYICLPGYPDPLTLLTRFPTGSDCGKSREDALTKNLAKFTYDELSEIYNPVGRNNLLENAL